MNPPLVSVVMPSFNQAAFIGAAIDSIFAQDHARLELVVADGGSTDGTLDILADRRARHAGLYWTSEPDSGPTEAINKALAKARGTIIGWLNADDLYTPGAITRALRRFGARPDLMMVYGHGAHVDAAAEPIGPYPTLKPEAGIAAFAAGCYICQPTVFFKRAMYVMLGPLDTSLSASFDFDYWLRAFAAFPDRIGFVDAVQALSRLHDDTITRRNRRTVALEGLRLTASHLGRAEPHWVTSYLEQIADDLAENRQRAPILAEAEAFLQDAEPFLAPSDMKSMRRQLERFVASATAATNAVPR